MANQTNTDIAALQADIKRLRADRKKIALASSAQADELKVYKQIAEIEDLVDGETSKDDVKKSKPHPDVFAAALESLGNPPFVLATVQRGNHPPSE